MEKSDRQENNIKKAITIIRHWSVKVNKGIISQINREKIENYNY